MEKIKASYEISQKHAILAGRSTWGKVEVEVDPASLTQEQRVELCECASRGFPANLASSIDGSSYIMPDDEQSKLALADPKDAVTIVLNHRIAFRQEKKEKKAAERQAKLNEFLTSPVEKFVKEGTTQTVWDGQSTATWTECYASTPWDLPDDPALKDRIDAVKAEVDRINESRRARAEVVAKEKEAARLVKEAEEQAARERKAAQIAAWVETHGTESQKKRLAADLLPEKEAVDGIRSNAFALLDGFERYSKLRGSDFCECDWTDNGSLDFAVEDCDEATEAEFDLLERIQALMPDATVTLRCHMGKCDRCEGSDVRKSIRVEMTVGEFTFSREYAAE